MTKYSCRDFIPPIRLYPLPNKLKFLSKRFYNSNVRCEEQNICYLHDHQKVKRNCNELYQKDPDQGLG